MLKNFLINAYRFILGSSAPNLLGDRDIEWTWVTSQMPKGTGFALDFGTGGSMLGLAAAQRGFEVTSVDLLDIKWPYEHENLHFIRGDIIELSLPLEHFDLVLNCSTVEHVGLVGRYDVKKSRPNGDLETMMHLKKLMKRGGLMLLTIPIGRDATVMPLHRIYGKQRLPLLIKDYKVQKEVFWIKNEKNRWIKAKKEDALNFIPSRSKIPGKSLYALGCFVLES